MALPFIPLSPTLILSHLHHALEDNPQEKKHSLLGVIWQCGEEVSLYFLLQETKGILCSASDLGRPSKPLPPSTAIPAGPGWLSGFSITGCAFPYHSSLCLPEQDHIITMQSPTIRTLQGTSGCFPVRIFMFSFSG